MTTVEHVNTYLAILFLYQAESKKMCEIPFLKFLKDYSDVHFSHNLHNYKATMSWALVQTFNCKVFNHDQKSKTGNRIWVVLSNHTSLIIWVTFTLQNSATGEWEAIFQGFHRSEGHSYDDIFTPSNVGPP